MTNRTPNLMATISAHPIFCPFLFQPGRSFHESHSFSRIMPMPQDKEASTQKSMDEVTGGFDRMELQKSRDNLCATNQCQQGHERQKFFG